MKSSSVGEPPFLWQDKLEPEEKALLVCCRPFLSTFHREELSRVLTTPGFDWNRFETLAQGHRMSPWVMFHLTREDSVTALIPIQRKEEYKRRLKALTVRDLSQWDLLRRVADAFHQAEIPVIVLKGVAFHRLLYPEDLAARGADDLDLLIPANFRKQADRILRGLAFLPQPRLPYRIPEQNYSAHSGQGASPLDLHWGITPSAWVWRWPGMRRLNQDLWRHRIPLDSLPTVSTLIPEMQLLVQTVNLYKDGRIHLRDLVDLARFLHRFAPSLNWHRIRPFAQRYHMEAALGYALRLSQALFSRELEGVDGSGLKVPWHLRRILDPVMTLPVILRQNHRRFGCDWMWPRAAFGVWLVVAEFLWYRWYRLCYDNRTFKKGE